MNTNFEHYRIFYYVAKYGNLTKAATVLHTSQPSVTRTIHNLEKNLNCRLFERSKVGMKLTPEGEVFYEYIAAGCAQFFKAESNLSDMLSLENGTIYVSATETALHCYLFQAMESFNEQYPNVHFKILNNSTRKSINIVKEGNVDFAVVSAPFQIEKPLQQKVLRKYHDILIGGKRFEELKGQKISIKQLAQYPWISLTPEAITRKFLNQYFETESKTYDNNGNYIWQTDTFDAFGGGMLFGWSFSFANRINLDIYTGGGIRKTFNYDPAENTYYSDGVFDYGYSGIVPRLGIDIGFWF